MLTYADNSQRVERVASRLSAVAEHLLPLTCGDVDRWRTWQTPLAPLRKHQTKEEGEEQQADGLKEVAVFFDCKHALYEVPLIYIESEAPVSFFFFVSAAAG
jgi:hypothetical protein